MSVISVKDLIGEYSVNLKSAGSSPPYSEVALVLDEFRDAVKKLGCIEQEILEGLNSLFSDKRWRDSDLWLIAAQLNPSPIYAKVLCNILELGDEAVPNELVVDLMIDLKRDKFVPYLEKAVEYEFNSDPFKHLSLKCLEALCEINSKESKEVLKKIANSSNEVIRDEAAELLKEIMYSI